jgi:Uma2 family endonuclease
LLEAQAPSTLIVGENVGTGIDRDPRRTTLRVPDLTVLHAAAMDRNDAALQPTDIVLVVEVLSPNTAGYDAITKRHQYGKGGIPLYWIVNPKERTLMVLRHNGVDAYDDVAVVSPGQTWRTSEPFPLTLDPADFL